MKNLLLASTLLIGSSVAAGAVQIISFGQTSGSNTVVATESGSLDTTTLTITDASVLIDQLFGTVTPPAISAFMDLTATSTDAAIVVGATGILQHYDGSFCISSGVGCTGTIDLEGSFTDAAFGNSGGTQLSVNVSNPPDALTFASDVIPSGDLSPPGSLTLAFSNVTPPLQITGTSIGSFGASFSGTADASVVPEPASLALLGMGLLGLGFIRRARE